MQIKERCESGKPKKELQNRAMNEHRSVRRFGIYPFAASAFPATVILPSGVKIALFLIPS